MRFKNLCVSLCVAASSLAQAAEDSSIACYFLRPDGTTTWQWALKSDNSWYSLSGDWKTTSYTRIKKFFSTNATYQDVCDACENSRKYYRVTGSLLGIFAATQGVGYNYPLVLGGAEVSPAF